MKNSNNQKTIVFIAMALSQPRCIKRVESFKDYGFNCVVYGYERGKYDVNGFLPDIMVHNLGMLKDNEYIGKGIKVFRDVIKITRLHRSKDTTFYAFGMFQALYLMLLRKRYIYEISDILYAYPKFMHFLKFIKAIDKIIIKRSIATVMTSGGFYTFYGIKSSRVFVVPNKVSPSLKRSFYKNDERNDSKTEKLSFGFVGSLRYKTITDFAEVIGERFPQYEFHFWGGVDDNSKEIIDKLTTRYGNIKYHGVFRSPTDLPSVYGSFDVTVSCYQVSSLNERIAEPNKLYESMFFCKPIVVSKGIYLSERVREMNCGYCIDASSKESISSFVSSLRKGDVLKLSKTLSQMDESLIVNNQEALNDFVLKS